MDDSAPSSDDGEQSSRSLEDTQASATWNPRSAEANQANGEAGPESGAEPLSMRDIEQVVVPQSYYKSDDEVDDEKTEERSAALRPVDLGSLAPPPVEPSSGSLEEMAAQLDDSTSSEEDPFLLRGRDFEAGLTASTAPESDSEPLSLRDVEEDLSPPRAIPKHKKRSAPPPLPRKSELPGPAGPPLAHGAAGAVDESRVPLLAHAMFDRLAASDYEGAFLSASALLRIDPKSSDALQAVQIAKVALYRLYDKRLGSRNRVPTLVLPTDQLRFQPLDARSLLVMSQVGGARSIDDVINSGILPKLDALRILSELYLGGIIGFLDEM